MASYRITRKPRSIRIDCFLMSPFEANVSLFSRDFHFLLSSFSVVPQFPSLLKTFFFKCRTFPLQPDKIFLFSPEYYPTGLGFALVTKDHVLFKSPPAARRSRSSCSHTK